MRVLLLGGSGFIGSSIIKYLKSVDRKDLEIFVADLKNPNDDSIKYIYIDLLSLKSCSSVLSQCSPDIVIHCAGVSDSSDYYRSLVKNSPITASLCNALDECKFKGRVIYLSSIDVYGLGDTKEGSILNPCSLSGINSITSEQMLLLSASTNPFKLCILRLPIIYGDRENYKGDIINNSIHNCLIGEEVITIDKESELNICHIDVVCSYLISLLKSKNEVFNTIYNISGQKISIDSILQDIVKLVGFGNITYMKGFPINWNTNIDDSKIRNLFKVKKINLTNKVLKSIVEFRKDYLRQAGWKEFFE